MSYTGPIQHNLSAVVDPTVGDDDTLGYQPGSIWINTNTTDDFVCTDNSTGAAFWEAGNQVDDINGSLAEEEPAALPEPEADKVELVQELILSQARDQVDFDDLDGDAYSYRLIFETRFQPTNAGEVYVDINDDQTETNYWNQYVATTNSDGINAINSYKNNNEIMAKGSHVTSPAPDVLVLTADFISHYNQVTYAAMVQYQASLMYGSVVSSNNYINTTRKGTILDKFGGVLNKISLRTDISGGFFQNSVFKLYRY